MKYPASKISSMLGKLDGYAQSLLPTLARIVFAGVLAMYFWASAFTKLGPGPFGFLHPSDAAYIQIFPKTVESFGYDFDKLGFFHWAIATSGTIAELLLPALIIVGFMTRLAALGMIGFIVVQSVTDILGHGVSPDTIGQWFDNTSGAVILDQRSLWVMLLAVLIFKGPGPISLDYPLSRRFTNHQKIM